jgi:hypothetical protein
VEGADIYAVVQHRIKDPAVAFARGEALIKNEGAPAGVRGLQFYPARDGSIVTCFWESPSIETVQEYVDTVMGDASENTSYGVDAGQAFANQPSGIRASAGLPA